MTDDTEDWRGESYPAPGKWSIAWVEGDGIRWRYDDTGDRIFDGTTAQLWLHQDRPTPFGSGVHVLRVDGDEVDRIDASDYPDRDDLFDRIGDLLAEHTPD